ncbi:MAG: hypothetical protein IJA14_00315 [Alphaproteobacteria bacterium]|nr:hypothetical protein [Alphaproteobacteria bacterium]
MAVYSEDLRVRVVEFLEKGHTQKEAAEVIGVSAKSVWIWNKMHKEGKRLVFEFVPRSPHRINHEKLSTYVKEHPDAYLREIAAHFSVAITTIWNALRRLGVSYKKTHNLPRSGLEKTEKICRISKKAEKK